MSTKASESLSTTSFVIPSCYASSIPVIISEWNTSTCRISQKTPHPATPKLPLEAPSLFNFIKPVGGNVQLTWVYKFVQFLVMSVCLLLFVMSLTKLRITLTSFLGHWKPPSKTHLFLHFQSNREVTMKMVFHFQGWSWMDTYNTFSPSYLYQSTLLYHTHRSEPCALIPPVSAKSEKHTWYLQSL